MPVLRQSALLDVPDPESVPALQTETCNKTSLLRDTEEQLEKFCLLFKELIKHLTPKLEELTDGQARNCLSTPLHRNSEILRRGHLNDPDPEDDEPQHTCSSTVLNLGHRFSDDTRLSQIVHRFSQESHADAVLSDQSMKHATLKELQTLGEAGKAGVHRSFQSGKSDHAIANKSLLKKKTTANWSTLPMSFEVGVPWRAILDDEQDEDEPIRASTPTARRRLSSVSGGSDAELVRGNMSRANIIQKFSRWRVIQPNAPQRLLWDLAGLLFLMHDLIWIPLLMCGAPEGDASDIIQWVLRIYWTFDIPGSFMTGFVDQDGEAVMDSQKVAARYCRGWLFFDMILVLSDWIEMVLVEAQGLLRSARFGKLMRTMRVIRMIRLARLAKLPGILSKFLEHIFAESTVMVMSITQITAVFLGFCHIVACIWFKLAADHEDSDNWLEVNNLGITITGESYAVSMHWAVTCFIGNMEVYAQNTDERVFSIVVLIMSFLASASFVSAITTSITRLQIINGNEQTQFSTLRIFLRSQAVSAKLALRITKSAKWAVKAQKHNVNEKDVDLLCIVSNPLKVEMHYDIHSRHLRVHALLRLYCSLNPPAMRRICHDGISTLTITSTEIVFRRGARSDPGSMLFVTHGALAYTTDDREDKMRVETGQYAVEQAIWLANWVHRGKMIGGSTESTLMRLHAEKFQEIMCEEFEPSDVDHPAWYAVWFLGQMCDLEPHLVNDLDFGCEQSSIIERHRQLERYREVGGIFSRQRSISGSHAISARNLSFGDLIKSSSLSNVKQWNAARPLENDFAHKPSVTSSRPSKGGTSSLKLAAMSSERSFNPVASIGINPVASIGVASIGPQSIEPA